MSNQNKSSNRNPTYSQVTIGALSSAVDAEVQTEPEAQFGDEFFSKLKVCFLEAFQTITKQKEPNVEEIIDNLITKTFQPDNPNTKRRRGDNSDSIADGEISEESDALSLCSSLPAKYQSGAIKKTRKKKKK